jgi:polyisoprenoid-binding protein YceI
MFHVRKIFTALTITAALASSAFAAQPANENLLSHTDFMVKRAAADVKHDVKLNITYDVLTASHTFEPEDDGERTLVADITITPIKRADLKDNDA